MSQEFQDWETVVFKNIPSSTKKNQKKTIENRVQDSIKSQNANHFKLENETENFRNLTIPIALSKEIQQKRMEQKLTQKELAQKLNTQPTIIQELENGKALYQQETKKMIRQLENLWKIKFQHKA